SFVKEKHRSKCNIMKINRWHVLKLIANRKLFIVLIALTGIVSTGQAQQIALVKYQGGGDWYANPTSLPNLIAFCNAHLGTKIDEKPATVTPGSTDIFSYPFCHMTGHGNVVFDKEERENLRKYLK